MYRELSLHTSPEAGPSVGRRDQQKKKKIN